MFAEGSSEGDRVRMVAGDVDGHGLVYAEYYAPGGGLRGVAPYARVLVDGEPTTVRDLHDLVLEPQQTPDGFVFTAHQGSDVLRCTALLWSEADVACTRDPAWVPPIAPACAAAFQGEVGRFQCNGLRDIFKTPAIDHDELLRACTASFRWESNRTDCMRYGYNVPAPFRDALAACTAVYRTEAERKFCMFYSLAPAREQDRIPARIVRACGPHDDDRATTDCAFQMFTGVAQKRVRPRSLEPGDEPTQPLAPLTPSRVTHVEVGTGAWNALALHATGGMVGGEPVLWVDARATTGKLEWMNPIPRIVIGKQVRALREVTALDHLSLTGDVLTFHVVHAGKSLQCRGDAKQQFARCR